MREGGAESVVRRWYRYEKTVWYKEMQDTKASKDKADSVWAEGVWLGHNRESNEILIGTAEGVVRAFAVIRKQEGQRWDKERIKGMRGTPQQPDPRRGGMRIPLRITFDEPSTEKEEETTLPKKEAVPRRMKINEQDYEEHGFTEGCEGCRVRKAGLQEYRPHTEGCRKRMGEALKEGGTYDERVRKRMAEEVEI